MDIHEEGKKNKEISIVSEHLNVSYSPQTQHTNKNLEPPKEKFELIGKKKLNRMKTVSLSSLFNQDSKKKKKQGRWEKLRKCLYYSVDNIYLHIFVLILSVYSLFLEDISHLGLPKSVDKPFKYINEGVFFFFLTEFLILSIAKKKFVGSFYFYLDLVSITSLLPNCSLIWDPLIDEIAGTGEKVQHVLHNSHLTKTSRVSQAGSKASKYLRLLRLINFIKVIRVAKVVESTKKVKSNITKVTKSKPILKGKKTKREAFLLEQKEAVDKILALSLKYQNEGIIQKGSNSIFSNKNNLNRNRPATEKEIKPEIGNISNEKELYKNDLILESEQVPLELHIKLDNKMDNLHHQDKLNEIAIHKKSNSGKNLNTIHIRPSLASKQIEETNTHIQIGKKKRGVNYLQKKNSFNTWDSQPKDTNPIVLNKILDNSPETAPVPLKIQNSIPRSSVVPFKKINIDFDEKLTINENSKRLSVLFSTVKPYVENMLLNMKKRKQNNLSVISSDNSEDIMDEKEEFEIEKKILTIKNSEKLDPQQEEFKKWDPVLIENKIKEPKKNIDEELYKEVSRKSNTKLEKTLIDGITHQVIILIMILLIAYPMLDPNFFYDLLYPDDVQPIRSNFCIDLIFLYMSYSVNDSYFLKPLNLSINQCFYSIDFYDQYNNKTDPEVERFLSLEFNDSQLFSDLQDKYKISLFTNKSEYLRVDDYTKFMQEKREEYDYLHTTYNMDLNNNITLYYDTHSIGDINSVLNMMKSIYVAFLLVFGSYVSSLDVSDLVITPLDKIFTKLNLNLKNLELIDKDEPDQKQIMQENPNEISEVLNLSNLFKDEEIKALKKQQIIDPKFKTKKISKAEKNLKNSLEPYFIDRSLYWLLKLIEMSIGKMAFLIIPISNLDKELKLNLNCPAIQYSYVGLFLIISNTDELFYKYMNKAPAMLSKILNVFHSLGVVFQGEPYKKDNLNVIIWKKNRKEWLQKSKVYAESLLKKNPYSGNEQDEEMGILDELYHLHIQDFAAMTAIKVINTLLSKLKKTMLRLKQCRVRLDFFINSGDMQQCILGDENWIYDSCYGQSISKVTKIMETLHHHEAEVALSYVKHSQENLQFLPRLLIDDSVHHLLHSEIKKFCAPFEIFLEDSQGFHIPRTVYRHFYNYSTYLSEDELNESLFIDNFNLQNFKTENVYKQRMIFEKIITREEDKTGFDNFILSDEGYLQATSEFNPSFQTALNLAYESFKELDYNKSLNIIIDLQKIYKKSEVTPDCLIGKQLDDFQKILYERLNLKSDDQYYTLKLFP